MTQVLQGPAAAGGLAVEPVLSYPSVMEPGNDYLFSVDLRPLDSAGGWPAAAGEEYAVHCLVNGAPLFRSEPLGEGAMVVHRFGGTYGPARFLLRPTRAAGEGVIRVTLVNAWGVPLATLETPPIPIRPGGVFALPAPRMSPGPARVLPAPRPSVNASAALEPAVDPSSAAIPYSVPTTVREIRLPDRFYLPRVDLDGREVHDVMPWEGAVHYATDGLRVGVAFPDGRVEWLGNDAPDPSPNDAPDLRQDFDGVSLDALSAGLHAYVERHPILRSVGREDLERLDSLRAEEQSPWNDMEPGALQYLRAALPEVYVGEPVVLAVQVRPDKSPLKVDPAGGEELDIVVEAREGFTVEGSTAETLRIPRDGSTARLEFRLRAGSPGPGLVRVYAFHSGTCLGTLTLRPVVRAALFRSGGAGQSPAPGQVRLASMLNGVSSFAPADLSLLILEQRDQGLATLSIRVTAQDDSLGLNLKEFGPVVLRMEPVEYFRDFFGDIEALGERGEASPQMIQQKLESKGARLFESIFPKELQALLWAFRHRTVSVQISSDEAWIPWEICRMTGESDGTVVEGPFFCEAFAITRWIPGIARRPRLTLEKMALVVPRDSGLQSVQDERRFFLSLVESGISVQEVPASYVDVRRALASGTFDAFHFAGHGTVRSPDPDRSAIRLEGGDELRPEEIRGVLRNLGRSTPLVFLNSCRDARGDFPLVGAGDWARRYLDAGAGAFIGAYWAVSDQEASAFAQAFYREMYAGSTLASAVRSARLSIRSSGDPTWLAYTVYGDPMAVRWQPPADRG